MTTETSEAAADYELFRLVPKRSSWRDPRGSGCTAFSRQYFIYSFIRLFPFLTDSVSETESPGSDRYGVTVSVTDSIILDTD